MHMHLPYGKVEAPEDVSVSYFPNQTRSGLADFEIGN
jgi:hypothetical protein